MGESRRTDSMMINDTKCTRSHSVSFFFPSSSSFQLDHLFASFMIYCFVYLMSILCRGFSTPRRSQRCNKNKSNCIYLKRIAFSAINNNKSVLNNTENRIWCCVSYCTQSKITRSSLISICGHKQLRRNRKKKQRGQKKLKENTTGDFHIYSDLICWLSPKKKKKNMSVYIYSI